MKKRLTLQVFKKTRLKRSFIKSSSILLVICSLMVAAQYCAAQAVPDTSLNNIIRDTAGRKRSVPDTGVVAHPKSDAGPLFGIKPKAKPFQPDPKKAGLYSALLPGLGQIYNRQYWKLPLVYGGLGVAGYFFIHNLNNYQTYRKAYIGRINNNNPTDKYVGIYSESQLQQLQDDYNKYLDLTVLLSAIGCRYLMRSLQRT